MTATPTTMAPKDPGEKVDAAAKALKHLGYAETFVEIADQIALTDTRLNNIRHGANTISDDMANGIIERMCRAFGVTTSDLFDEDVQRAVGYLPEEPEAEAPEDPGEAEATEAEDGPEPKDAEETDSGPEPVEFPPDRIDIEHGDVQFHAVKLEDGTWSVRARVKNDEVVRLLGMSVYREMFGIVPEQNGEPNEEES